ncbi:MAG: hypothetical protein WCI94_22150 [Rhodospirillales bacterium]
MNAILHTLVISLALCLCTPSKAQTFAFGGSAVPASLTLSFGDGSSATIEAATQGWWSATQANFNGNTNIVTGHMFDIQWNDFFVFDLTGRAGTVLSAGIGLNTGIVAGSPAFSLWDVSTSLTALLNLDTAPSAEIYTDLGSGVAYTDSRIAITTGHTDIEIALDSAAIAAIEAALGGRFAIGGSANIDIPEPSSALLLVSVTVAGYLRRQASKRSALS